MGDHFGLVHPVTRPSPKDPGWDLDRQEEAGARGMASAIDRGRSAAWHPIVDRERILKGSVPGVKHSEEPGVFAAQPAGAVPQGLDGLGGGFEQGGVAEACMAAQGRPQGPGTVMVSRK